MTQQHNRDHDEFQEVDENVTKGFQVTCGKGRIASEIAHQANRNAQRERDQDLYGQT